MKKWISILLAMQVFSTASFAKGKIQNEDVKSLTDITAAVLTTTGNLSGGNACITSLGSTSGLATGLYVYDTTTPANINSGVTIAGLPGTCSAGQIQMSSTAAGSGTGDTITFGGQSSQLINDTKIWLTSISPAQQLSTAISKGAIGGGGGSKNYLSTYVTSTAAGASNPGNGNFEQGTVNNWSLAHSSLSSLFPTSVASAGTAFDATHGGSAANGNLSFSLVTSGQLQGNDSASLASSTASTAGDLLISSAYNIDTEDQGKMMTFKFYYSVNSGAANMNFSGTSSNTYAIYIYDVTNGAWIQPAGVYNLVQNSGTGYATGTFQTTSNSTKYQFALVNVNASAGSFALYVDDFFVGPQTAPSGPVMSDEQSYTLTVGATTTPPTFGTIAQNLATWKRVGDSVLISYTLSTSTNGSAGSGTYLFPLPAGLVADTAKITQSTNAEWGIVGPASLYSSFSGEQSAQGYVKLYDTTHLAIVATVAKDTSTVADLFNFVGSSLMSAANNITYSFQAKVPIVGWSSNTQQSNDTDTRVIALHATRTSSLTISGTTDVVFDSASNAGRKEFDTAGAYNTSTGVYTVPVSGMYEVSGSLFWQASGTVATTIVLSDSSNAQIAQLSQNNSLNDGQVQRFGKIFQFKAGDTFKVRVSGGTDLLGDSSATNQYTTFDVLRLSGPAVVQATETVAASYYSATNASVTAHTPTNFEVKEFDTHNAVTTGAGSWKFTAPVAGYYQIEFTTQWGGTTNVDLYKNGSADYVMTSCSTSNPCNGAKLVQMVAGDYIDLRPFTTQTLNTGGGTPPILSHVSIFRLQNH